MGGPGLGLHHRWRRDPAQRLRRHVGGGARRDDEAQGRLHRRDAGPVTAQTVGEYLTYWLDEVARYRVRESTLASYRWLTRTYVLPYLGSRKLARLRPADVRSFLDRLKGICQCCALGKDAKRASQGRGARPDAAHGRRGSAAARSFPTAQSGTHTGLCGLRSKTRSLRTCVAQNPAKNLRISHRYRPKFTPWSAEEARRFLVTAREDRLFALYAVALGLGLRRGELLALRWVDVDLVDNVVTVVRHPPAHRWSAAARPGEDRRVRPPVGHLRRVAAVFRQHRSRQRDERATRWRPLAEIRAWYSRPSSARRSSRGTSTGTWTGSARGPACRGSGSTT